MKGFKMTEVMATIWQPENTKSIVLVTSNGLDIKEEIEDMQG